MIPKVIHYCWFGGKPLPAEVRKCINSWEKYAPDYEIIQWNETNFDVYCHPFVQSAYDAKAWAFVSDFARLKIIYDNGGVYFDTDVELRKNMDFLLDNKCYLGVQQEGHLCATGLGFGAEKHSSIIKAMLSKYDDLIFKMEIKEKIACPYLNHSVIAEVGYQYSEEIWYHPEVTVYPCRYFDPIAPGNADNLLSNDTISVHNYAASWTSGGNRFKRKLFRMIGQERINAIKNLLKNRK